MANIEDASWKARDAASYDDVADDFDRLTERVSMYAATELANALPANAKTILDVGCGTGIVMLSVAKGLPESTQITGIDLSPVMLANAKRNAQHYGLTNKLSFIVGDAEALPMDDCSVDAVTSLYAWRHLPHPARATAEVFRVLKPGGTFAVAVGSAPPLASVTGIFSVVERMIGKVAEARGRQLAACRQVEALVDHHLPSLKNSEEANWTKAHHGFSGSMISLVKDAGFKSARSRYLAKTFRFSDVDEFWRLQTTFSSKARKRIADASPEVITLVHDAFVKQCNEVIGNGGNLVYRVGAALVSAVKPVD
jgi:ubiquinone/menaquinone biosynthesis C-methylase UbiE